MNATDLQKYHKLGSLSKGFQTAIIYLNKKCLRVFKEKKNS